MQKSIVLFIIIIIFLVIYYQNLKYEGPCLKHCYKRPDYLILLLVFILGYLTNNIYNKKISNKKLIKKIRKKMV